MTNQQLETLLAKVSHGHRLKVLNLEKWKLLLTLVNQVLNLAENDLSLVEERILAEAVVALEEVDLTASSLTVAQGSSIIITTIINHTSYLSFFLYRQNFGLNFSPHRKCVYWDKTGFATIRRKLQLNRFVKSSQIPSMPQQNSVN